VERPTLEVADIFRDHGHTWRHQERGHLSLGQLKVMSAIERCRSAALGGHALRCSACAQPQIAYNSCRNRHCPKCQSSAAQRWLEARQAELLPVPYYHVVFTLPAPISAIAYTNKEIIYGLLFDIAAETLRTIAADPKHLGARIGVTLVLHTWGSALTHHPHVHGIVPGGGFALEADQWVPCKPGFFLSVRVLSRLFRRRFLEELQNAHRRGQLKFFGEHLDLSDAAAFADWLTPLRQCEWVVYAKRPFAGPEAVLAYLSRYTHRVAISNRRLVALDDRGVTFRWKDYRAQGRTRYKTMTLRTEEFMRRFLLHVLPSGFHRIRHYGLLANARRKTHIATARKLLHQPAPVVAVDPAAVHAGSGAIRPTFVCRHCGAPMLVIETFAQAPHIRGPPASPGQP
jgi:putative transposase/transposase-like zinc-binding protein